MAYSAAAVANAFIQRAIDGEIPDLTPMKLQKLMFYAQSWSLKIYKEPIFDDFFAKWQYGPVIPSIYHEVKKYGASKITSKISNVEFDGNELFSVQPMISSADKKINALIDKIIEVYGSLRGTQLSYLTHQEGTAWDKANKAGIDVLSNDLLRESKI
ncbi:DUF4065 domain-containing protein [Proteus mirabilis]|uniref:Panacea domain-containing protein n=1 Tax=Proteus mirabilis TaxID=584 RepID=UPI001BA315D5|nr:DUF4065 domain-containing protein [Proteus mirabilis]HBC8686245.1 DUF4065 domain-containing protein [Proteus mirabilis]HEK2142014.1 DUF4065 domain-containing protein [Proteus mirabilis]HEK2927853.1 DUF4065 domain-containing protein [Proteus mirabilis]